MAQQTVREFTVRAAGSDRQLQKFVLGKFPLGAPELKMPGTSWQKSQRECPVAKLERTSTRELETKPASRFGWVLEDTMAQAPQPLLVGQPEAGMGNGGSGASYFLLVRSKGGGDDFLAMPVSEWQNFKPVAQRQTNSLEEAEAEMKRKRLAIERVNPRLAQAVKKSEGDIVVPGDEEEHDSDEEWKDVRARAAARAAAKPAVPQRRQKAAAAGEEEEREEEDHADKSDKGEDWEHEDERADDDVDMGEGEDDAAADVSPVRRRAAGSVSSDDEEENVAPAKVKRQIKRMMRQTGLEGSDEEDESEGEEESESIEDDEDLDKMAEGELPGGRARSPTPGTAAVATAAAAEGGGGQQEGAGAAAGKKRKAPTPPPAGLAAGAAAATAARVAAEQAAKRARTAAGGGAAGGVDGGGGAPGAAAAGAAGGGGAVVSPVSAEEVRALLLRHGRMPLKEIAAHFKAKLKSPEERNAFSQLVKQLAKLESAASADGQRYLVLR